MRAVITTTSAIAINDPPGMDALIVDGQTTDGSTNQPRKEINPSNGESSPVGDAAIARPKAVVHTIPTVR